MVYWFLLNTFEFDDSKAVLIFHQSIFPRKITENSEQFYLNNILKDHRTESHSLLKIDKNGFSRYLYPIYNSMIVYRYSQTFKSIFSTNLPTMNHMINKQFINGKKLYVYVK